MGNLDFALAQNSTGKIHWPVLRALCIRCLIWNTKRPGWFQRGVSPLWLWVSN